MTTEKVLLLSSVILCVQRVAYLLPEAGGGPVLPGGAGTSPGARWLLGSIGTSTSSEAIFILPDNRQCNNS